MPNKQLIKCFFPVFLVVSNFVALTCKTDTSPSERMKETNGRLQGVRKCNRGLAGVGLR